VQALQHIAATEKGHGALFDRTDIQVSISDKGLLNNVGTNSALYIRGVLDS
jgi:hypothetical protein